MAGRERVAVLLLLGVVLLAFMSLIHPESPTSHDELLQRASRGRVQLHQRQQRIALSSDPGHHMGANEGYNPAQDCLHVKCKVSFYLIAVKD